MKQLRPCKSCGCNQIGIDVGTKYYCGESARSISAVCKDCGFSMTVMVQKKRVKKDELPTLGEHLNALNELCTMWGIYDADPDEEINNEEGETENE